MYVEGLGWESQGVWLQSPGFPWAYGGGGGGGGPTGSLAAGSSNGFKCYYYLKQQNPLFTSSLGLNGG